MHSLDNFRSEGAQTFVDLLVGRGSALKKVGIEGGQFLPHFFGQGVQRHRPKFIAERIFSSLSVWLRFVLVSGISLQYVTISQINALARSRGPPGRQLIRQSLWLTTASGREDYAQIQYRDYSVRYLSAASENLIKQSPIYARPFSTMRPGRRPCRRSRAATSPISKICTRSPLRPTPQGSFNCSTARLARDKRAGLPIPKRMI